MDCINELRDSLNVHLGWNKARITCFVNMLLALLTVRTVNLNKLACVVIGDAQLLSRYRRIQRFFAGFTLNYTQIAGFIFKLFFISGGQWYLSMDRTNWRWGNSDINILMLGIVFKGTAIPIYWMLLDKKGNSDTAERIELIQTFINQFGRHCIRGLLADREFIGKDWFAWLLREKIPFNIRIRNNTITTNSRGLEIDIDALFYGLKPGDQLILKGRRIVLGHLVYLAGLRLADGELLIVATSVSAESAIITYGLRWEIESLFGCFKGRGFNFEDTHITDKERIKKLVALLAIAFAWAHRTGEWQSILKPIKIKKHGRPAISLFRYGLDFLCNAIIRLAYKADRFQQALDILNGAQFSST
jgi:hypothetical protein